MMMMRRRKKKKEKKKKKKKKEIRSSALIPYTRVMGRLDVSIKLSGCVSDEYYTHGYIDRQAVSPANTQAYTRRPILRIDYQRRSCSQS